MRFNTSWLLLVLAYIAGLTIMSIGCGEIEETTTSQDSTRIEGSNNESAEHNDSDVESHEDNSGDHDSDVAGHSDKDGHDSDNEHEHSHDSDTDSDGAEHHGEKDSDQHGENKN